MLADCLRRSGVQSPESLVEAYERGEFGGFDWGEGVDGPVEDGWAEENDR